MAKTDRTVLISNDQEFGQVADPNKLETQITHAFEKIDENDTEFQNFKTAAELPTPSQSVTTDKLRDGNVTEPKLADDSVSRRTIIAGAVGKDELDPTLWEQTASKVKFNEIDSRLSDISLNVKDFGAKGDGITDDTDAIQAAINQAISNGGGIIFLPSGTYSLNKTIPAGLVPYAIRDPNLMIENGNNIKLMGTGNSVLKPTTNANLAEILLVYKCTNIEIEGVKFVGDNTGLQPTDNNAGLAFASVVGFHVHHCSFSGFQGSYFVGDWAFNTLVEMCQFNVSSGSAFDVAFLQDFTVRKCDMRGNGAGQNNLGTQGFQCHYDPPNESRNLTGINLVNGISNNINLIDNRISGFKTGIYLADLTDTNIINNHIFNNYIETAAGNWGISIGSTRSEIKMDGIMIKDNKIHNNGSDVAGSHNGGAIILTSGNSGMSVDISLNDIFDNKADGVYISNTSSLVLLRATRNRIYNRVGSNQSVVFSGFVGITTDSLVIDNIGFNPKSLSVITPALPLGVGSTNAVLNNNPFPVTVYQNGGAGIHIVTPTGTDIAIGGGNQSTIRLLPYHKIYFSAVNTTAWTWSGE